MHSASGPLPTVRCCTDALVTLPYWDRSHLIANLRSESMSSGDQDLWRLAWVGPERGRTQLGLNACLASCRSRPFRASACASPAAVNAPPTAGRSRLCVLGHRTFHGRLQIRPSHTSLGEGPPRNSACRALLTQTHRRGAIIHSVETLAVTSVSGRHRTKNMHSHCPQLSNEQWYDFAIALYSF